MFYQEEEYSTIYSEMSKNHPFSTLANVLLIYAESLIQGIKNYSENRKFSPDLHICHVHSVSLLPSSMSFLFCSHLPPRSALLGTSIPANICKCSLSISEFTTNHVGKI